MRTPAAKPEEKRLDRSVQTGVDQIKIWIKLAANIKNGVQPRRELPDTWRNRHRKLDQRTKWRQHEQNVVPLGECRINISLLSYFMEQIRKRSIIRLISNH